MKNEYTKMVHDGLNDQDEEKRVAMIEMIVGSIRTERLVRETAELKGWEDEETLAVTSRQEFTKAQERSRKSLELRDGKLKPFKTPTKKYQKGHPRNIKKEEVIKDS